MGNSLEKKKEKRHEFEFGEKQGNAVSARITFHAAN